MESKKGKGFKKVIMNLNLAEPGWKRQMNTAEDKWLLNSHSIQCGRPVSLWRAGLTNLCSPTVAHAQQERDDLCLAPLLSQAAAGLGAQKKPGARILPPADGSTQEAEVSGPSC